MDGVFLTFEGSEGCGKSTQIRRLLARFDASGVDYLHVREPGGTLLGESVRTLLKDRPEFDGMAPEAELLLFAASRAQLVREKLVPALRRGVHVVADRFLDSTTVYQGVARGLDARAVACINRFAAGECLPQLTVLLDMDSGAARRRAIDREDGQPDRMEREGGHFFEKVRRGYLDLAKAEAGRFVVLDAGKPEEEIAESIWAVLVSRFHGVFE